MDGFSITPKRDCPHLGFLANIDIPEITYPNSCSECGDTKENWLCLECNGVLCSRYVHGHASRHAASAHHSVAISFADCSAWCYSCEDYVDHPLLRPFITAVQTVKFRNVGNGSEAPAPAPAPAPTSAEPSAAPVRTEMKVEEIVGRVATELDVEGCAAGEMLVVRDCQRCKIAIRGAALGAFVVRNCIFCTIEVQTVVPPADVGIDSCDNLKLRFRCPAVDVHVTGSSSVEIGLEKGWETVHTKASRKVVLYLPNKEQYRVLSSEEHIVTQIIKGQVVSEFTDDKKRGRAKQDAYDEEVQPIVPHSGRRLGHATDEEVKEYHDSEEEIDKKMSDVVDLVLKAAGSVIVYTGAGVSTSASIPDYRGPKGVWTARDKGESVTITTTFEEAKPTYCHMAISQLVSAGIVQLVVSTNVDGLHMRSGLGHDKLAELHGNAFLECCRNCKEQYLRAFDVTSVSGPHKTADVHSTGRDCDKCGKPLYDSIVHFGESLPQREIELAVSQSRCKLSLVLGTSMMVTPACDLPPRAKKMVICNLQKTQFDHLAKVRIFASTDTFMGKLCTLLNVAVPEYKRPSEK